MPEELWTDEQMYYVYLNFWHDYWEEITKKEKKVKEELMQEDNEELANTLTKTRVKMSSEVFTKCLNDSPTPRSEFLRVWRMGYHNSCVEMTSKLQALCNESPPLNQEEQVRQIQAILAEYNRYIFPFKR